ncbi:unnamed protein product [Haemonchus placei]|uniref:Integrase_H2C2 domain-containing protein n=1 Tax=Haemonchus placei TaxID=6290 RepID=A0A0N4WFV2_HAEPC|nr:unnamed protein product [Haemonchus placei]
MDRIVAGPSAETPTRTDGANIDPPRGRVPGNRFAPVPHLLTYSRYISELFLQYWYLLKMKREFSIGPMLGEAVDRPIIVDGVYDKQELDIVSPELLEEVGEYGESIDNSLHDAYGDEGEQERNGDDPYGGMPLDLYDNIVEFKRTGTYPPNIGARHDRSALSHWRARCLRFVLADDNETLLYYNPSSSVNDQPKVVVKRGEVRRVIERIHDLIGHLGQKRTQIVVLKKLHWRSVRQDVKTFINSCAFCNQKKLEGKKILKAPVDVTSDNFDLNVEVRNKSLESNGMYDRLTFSLIGYNEHEVRAAAVTRMTAYTFKETTNDMRGRFARPNSGTIPTNFRRQPYIKRTRYSPYASGFILPYATKHKNDEPGFIEIYQDDRPASLTTGFNGHVYPEEEIAEGQQIEESSAGHSNISASLSRPSSMSAKTEVRNSSHHMPTESKRDQCDNTEFLLSSYDAIQSRPEMTALPPIMLMPSVDPEVIHMQKELLMRQLRLQRMQEKVLQAQFNSMRLPIARYEEIDPDGERVQLLGEEDVDFIEEAVEEEQELNVMNSGDESGDEIIRTAPR